MVPLVSYDQGRKLDAVGLFDPMMAYHKDDKMGWSALRLRKDHELWRDSAALFQVVHDAPAKRPECFDWLQSQVERGALRRAQRYDVSVFGLCSDQAKVFFWRHDRMPLPLAYLDDKDLVDSLDNALERADAIARGVHDAVRLLATTLLAPTVGSPDKKRVRAFVQTLAPERLYWSRLEVPFRGLLLRLADHAGDGDGQQRAVADWVCRTLRPTALSSFEDTAGRLDQSARLLRAVARARQKLHADLARLTADHREVLHAPTA
jgi:CRISPR type I-E-associated protein CasA/Cse1